MRGGAFGKAGREYSEVVVVGFVETRFRLAGIFTCEGPAALPLFPISVAEGSPFSEGPPTRPPGIFTSEGPVALSNSIAGVVHACPLPSGVTETSAGTAGCVKGAAGIGTLKHEVPGMQLLASETWVASLRGSSHHLPLPPLPPLPLSPPLPPLPPLPPELAAEHANAPWSNDPHALQA